MRDNTNKKLWFFLLGLTATFSVYASNPASTDYVDAKIAILQAEIDKITQGKSG